MYIKLYQLNCQRDDKDLVYRSFERVKELTGRDEVPSELYDLLYEGEVPVNDLEGVFRIFNIDIPLCFPGRGHSVSDVVEVLESDTIKPGCYYCQPIGYCPVPFDTEKTQNKIPDMMEVVYVKPSCEPSVQKVGTGLRDMQRVVEGLVEPFFLEDDVAILCNEEGKLNGMPANRPVFDKEGNLLDTIYGPFMVCGYKDGSFVSLPKDKQRAFVETFRMTPEREHDVFEPEFAGRDAR